MIVLKRWIFELARLAVWLTLVLLLGLWFGRPAEWLLGGAGLCLVFLLRQVYRLDRFLHGGQPDGAPKTRSLWTQIFASLVTLKTDARARKKQYHRLLREVRQSTAALQDGGIILNSKHDIQWFNPAATRLLGLDPARDIGQRIENFIRNPDLVKKLAAPGGESIAIPAPQDPARCLSVQISPYGDNQSVATIRDVTHQVKVERTRRDFVANASHELRSPLTVISGYLDALAEAEELPQSWKVPISETQRQAERMTRILGDLIELMRLESEAGEAEAEYVDVGAMLDLIQKELAARPESPQLTLRLQANLCLLGNESELHSIFYNLINNAVRFTPTDGRIEVSWCSDDDGAVFSVSDTGIGIPEEHVPRITERFYRVDLGRSRGTGGTGLGLAIVKHALQRHNGRLSIDSRIDEGSRFACHFPEPRLARREGANRATV